MSGSLFQGTPQAATSYVTTTQEMPKWLQDAIYNQIQVATNVANRPYTPYTGDMVADLTPLQQQAYQQTQQNVGAYLPDMSFATSGMKNISQDTTAPELQAAQNPYLQPALSGYNLGAGQGYFAQAGGMNIPGAAQPLMAKAETTTGQSLAERALTAANPYLTAAGQTSASQVGQYMSPYQQGVLDAIAKQGARNLSENILPQVSDAFVRAGQFGSSRMGELGSRAIRDTQEAILKEQSQAMQQGYAQSMAAAQADLARQGQLAGTVGGIAGSDLSRILQGGAQYGSLGQATGQLTAQQMQALANLGQLQTGAGQAQQQFGLTAAQQANQAQAQDLSRQAAALQALSDITRQTQALRTADVAALEAAGSAQQRQSQADLDAARMQFEREQLYPRQQLDWLSTQIRGMAPITPSPTVQSGVTTGQTYSPSPLSQLATGLYTYKGLQNI